jgi:predicted 3-demethylubiquinone-9 3-methyltransferase (glyoxalase superfamily)
LGIHFGLLGKTPVNQGRLPVSKSNQMKNKITTFLMFNGRAEEALNFYVNVFGNSEISTISRYPDEHPELAGKIQYATFNVEGYELMCIDSPVKHDFVFNPSISLYVASDDEEEIERLFAALSDNGRVVMPLGSYGFSRKYGWLEDQFGVSWQLDFAGP